MPPKKNSANAKDDNVLLLGRIGTNLKVGIVGMPNVG
jgi:ribosome biogenesis GTPase A